MKCRYWSSVDFLESSTRGCRVHSQDVRGFKERPAGRRLEGYGTGEGNTRPASNTPEHPSRGWERLRFKPDRLVEALKIKLNLLKRKKTAAPRRSEN